MALSNCLQQVTGMDVLVGLQDSYFTYSPICTNR